MGYQVFLRIIRCIKLNGLKFRMWFKYGLKAQKLQKQHALKAQKLQKQHALKAQKVQKQHALKGQKPLAQGSALGNYGRKPVAL